MLRDHIILQAVVLIWGFTSILGKQISLPVQTLVVWRTGMAAAVLWAWLCRSARPAADRRWTRLALLNGCLIGFHWHLFFLAGRLGNVSVALIGAATCALWVALLEPLMIKVRKLHLRECLLALTVAGGVALVALHDSVPLHCLLTGVAAAAVAALFSIFNGQLVRHLPAVHLSACSMTSAAAFCAVLGLFTVPMNTGAWLPRESDWLPLLTLSLLCTVVAFSVCVWLQKRLSPFTIGIASNLEPVYGMALAAAVWPDSEVMDWRFYTGAALIIACLLAHSRTS